MTAAATVTDPPPPEYAVIIPAMWRIYTGNGHLFLSPLACPHELGLILPITAGQVPHSVIHKVQYGAFMRHRLWL